MRSSLTLKVDVAAAPVVKPVSKPLATGAAVSPYLIAASLGFLAISLAGSVLIDAEIHGLHHFIFCYLSLPVVALAYGVAWFGMPRWRESASQLKMISAPILIAVTILFTCTGLVNFANALLSKGAMVRFSGPITRLSYTSGRSSHGYYLVLSDSATGRPCEFRITRPEYYNLRVGYAYVRTMQQGGLGYAFQWRH
jgi:hypothetical protein